MSKLLPAVAISVFGLAPLQSFAEQQDPNGCNAIDFLDGLEVLNAEGVPSLKTRWMHAYTKPLVINATEDDSLRMGDASNYRSFSFAFSTNTFTNANDPSRLQTLFRASSLYNLYFGFVGLRTAKGDTKGGKALRADGATDGTQLDCKDPIINRRLLSTDRLYTSKDISADKYKFFISNGLGFRGVSSKDNGGSTKGLGTFYLGFGIDGPLYEFGDKKGDGFASAEFYLSYNRTNRHAMDVLFGDGNGFSSYSTFGVEFEVAVLKQMSIKLSYAKALNGAAKSQLGDLVLTRIALVK